MDTNAKKTCLLIALAVILFFSVAIIDSFQGSRVIIPIIDILAGWFGGGFWNRLEK